MTTVASSSSIVVANFNMHAGIDGWGTPYDVMGAAKAIDADVLVLCEAWESPTAGSIADDIANQLGYVAHKFPLANARRRVVRRRPSTTTWGPHLGRPRTRQAFAALRITAAKTTPRPGVEVGTWQLAVLTRVPVVDIKVIDLPDIRQEPAHRKAVFVRCRIGENEITVVGTHLGHLLHGSLRQILALRRALPIGPAALLGDMNCWGPPLETIFTGWKRAVRQRSWPAWQPHSQVDHIFVHGDVAVNDSEALADFGSDHRPVRATLSFGGVGAES